MIGGGAGHESGALAVWGFSVVSVDRSLQLTEAGRRLAGENERFRCLPVPEESVPPNRFDHAALWSQVLANIPGPERRRETLVVAARSLKPRGRLSFSVHEVEKTLALVDRGNLMIGLCHRPAEAEASTGDSRPRGSG